MELQKKFQDFIKEKNLFAKGEGILLAVSGGVDSVVMAELFHRCKFRFAIAHCNFQLRGDESVADEKFVRQLAVKYDVSFYCTHFDTKFFSETHKLSIQETARKLRYDWFAEMLFKHQYDSIATAHHFNDSIETFLINLLRGTGVSGLRGIQPVLENPRTIRPLLFAKKTDLESFAQKEKISFRLDHSNETDLYLRNRIRHHLMPVLLQLNPQFDKVMERTIQNLAFAESMVDETVVRNYLTGFDRTDEKATLTLHLKELKKHKYPLEMLHAIVQSFGFNFSQVEDIWQALTPGKQVFAGDFVLTADRQKLILSKHHSNANLLQYLETKDTNFHADAFHLSLNSIHKPVKTKYTIPASANTYVLDKDKLKFPLIIRKWEKGDAFYPLGMTRRKKISDFLTDKKVSRPDKEKTCVLLSGEEIICLVGHRIDDRFKVTEKTKNIYQVELFYK
ncbi:MAG: tRNA lysidine(34) synthetase TilS [Bacteroidota bacterium]